MGLNTSSNNYVNSNRSEFISSQQLTQILRGQRATDIYQSQISQASSNKNQYQSNYGPNQQNQQPNYRNPQTNYNPANSYQNHHQEQFQQSQYVRKVISFTEGSESIADYLNTLSQIGKYVECQNLYLPIMCKVQGEETVCTDYRKLQMYFQNYDVRITDEIAARKRERQIFAEQEVWYILYSILNACRKFEKFNMSSGSLKTQHVLLNGRGHIKIVNKLSFPQDQINHFNMGVQKRQENYQKSSRSLAKVSNCMNPVSENSNYPKQFVLHHNQNHNTSFISNSQSNYRKNSGVPNFYSPQQLRVMRQNIQKVVNPNISQTYSIAIIMLEICTSISGQKIYDMNNLTINQNAIKRAEQIMENRYSKLLNNLIKTMLSNAYDRPLPSQVYAAFKPYEKRILNLKPFKFDANTLKQTLPMSQVSF